MKLQTIIYLLLLTNCNSLTRTKSIDYAIEKERVENCRRKWTFVDISDTLTIKLITHEEKGRYHMSSWPNFYIGIDTKGDTIGVVENISNQRFKKGALIKFSSYEGEKDISRVLYMYPILRVAKKPKENDIYCSVEKVFYAKIIE